MRANIRDVMGTKLELRLGEPSESEIDRRVAANVPAKTPGRGITVDKLHFLGALSRIDGRHGVEDQGDGTAELVARVRDAWPYAPAPKVRLLPRRLPLDELVTLADRSAPGIPILKPPRARGW